MSSHRVPLAADDGGVSGTPNPNDTQPDGPQPNGTEPNGAEPEAAGTHAVSTPARAARARRETNETIITVAIDLDSPGTVTVSTGLPFFDHMLDQLGRHSGFSLEIEAAGDLHVDSHHTVEDTALLLGSVFAEAVGDKRGVRRFASGLFPLDEALVEIALDLSGRPFCAANLDIDTALGLGNPVFNPELVQHFFTSFATTAQITLHVNQRSGTNTHHIIEAAFKGLARCLGDAVNVVGSAVPSTKGVL